MKITYLLSLFLIISNLSLQSNEIDSLLNVLDVTIRERPLFNARKEHQMDSLKIKIAKTKELHERYNLYYELLRQYRHYEMDSALWVANERNAIAEKLNNEQYIYISNMNISEILGIMGMYKESLEILEKIDKQKLDKSQWTYYFHLHHSIYSLISENTLSIKEKKHYQQLISQYKDSLLQTIDPNSIGYSLVKNGKLLELEKYDESLLLMTQCYNKYQKEESLTGTLAYALSEVYSKRGEIDQEKKYLIISSIADLRRAVKGYIALRKLAILLYEQGDVERAYKYIKCSMEDATFCKARFRTLEISQALPIINAAYDIKIKKEKDNLIKFICLISVLSIILVISIIFIYKQMKKLSIARKSIDKMYEDLKYMNNDLSELNKKLSESNLIKEAYIGSIFSLCSTYIDKMESYRININRKLKSRQTDEAIKMTGSTSFVSDELKEFFSNFDAIFLNIYPNFIEEFNSLLIADEQIVPKSGDILTPELRIFALIRLGVSDSGKIATFLHYSPQTVYNYKLKVRNKLSVSKDYFLEAIHKIGK